MIDEQKQAAPELPRGRLIAGAVIFVTGQMAPLAIPLVAASSLPTSWKTCISGVLLLGVPEAAILLTIVVLGKEGFHALKSRIFGWIGRVLLPEKVSRTRYYIGLAVFMIPILIGWLSPYLHETVPELLKNRLTIAIAGDVTLIAGLCLMGGQFWGKLRSLFVYEETVTVPHAATGAD